MEKKLTHCDRTLRFLMDYGSITSWDAIKEFGNTRLSATIYSLRKDGWKISTEYGTSKNRYGDSVSFAIYKLESDEKGESEFKPQKQEKKPKTDKELAKRYWRELCDKYGKENLLNCDGEIFFIDENWIRTFFGRRVLWNLQLSKEQYVIQKKVVLGKVRYKITESKAYQNARLEEAKYVRKK